MSLQLVQDKVSKLKQISERNIKSVLSDSEFEEFVKFLEEKNLTIREFSACIRGGYLDFKKPICPVCGKEIQLAKHGFSFPKYCSHQCYYASDESKKKREQTNLKRYGAKSSLLDSTVKAKRAKTMLDRFGCEYTFQRIHPKQKPKSTKEKARLSKLNLNRSYISLLLKTKNSNIIPLFSRKEYKGAASYTYMYKWKCLKCGRVFEASYGSAKVPVCRVCDPLSISSEQREIIDMLKALAIKDLKVNTRDIIKPYELDIYIPKLKLAIEFNGDYWHCDKPEDYHFMKTRLCEEKGIRLIHIFEVDWKRNKEDIKNRLSKIILGNEDRFPLNTLGDQICVDRGWYSKANNVFLKNGWKCVSEFPPRKRISSRGEFWDCGILTFAKTY